MVRDTLAISARVRSWRLLVLKHSFYITQRTDRAWGHISHNFVIDMSWLNTEHGCSQLNRIICKISISSIFAG